MTEEAFMAFYPQFAWRFPEIVVSSFVEEANLRFGGFQEDAERARRLLVAHRLTRYARTSPPEAASGSLSLAALAAAGSSDRVAAKRVDDVSVAYASGASSASAGLADLTETAFGLELLALLRLHALPLYVPG